MALEYNFILFLLFMASCYKLYLDPTPITSKGYYVFIVVLMALVGGLRYKVGPDWPGYLYGYDYIQQSSIFDFFTTVNLVGFERGYVLLNYIVGLFGTEVWLFQLVLISLSLYLKTSTIFKYNQFAYLPLLFYFMPLFFFEDVIQIRQGFATGICVYSVRYIIDKKLWFFLLTVLLAYQFHKTALIFLPAYFIVNSKIDFTVLCLLTGFFILTAPLGLSKGIVPLLSLLPIDAVENGYNAYQGTGYTDAAGFSFNDIVKVSTFFVMILYNKQVCEKDTTYTVFRDLYLVSLCLYYFFRMEAIYSIRLSGYYAFFFGFVVAKIVYSQLNQKVSYLILTMIVLLYLSLLTFRFRSLQERSFGVYPNVLYNKIEPHD